nr:reverse transcriptase domain-containing protein [Tanacetum cinerariifolium]
PEEDECVKETYTDPGHAEYNIKVPPPPPVQKPKPPIQRNFVLHNRDTLPPSLVLMPKYQKMLKALLSNKEKLQELANTPLNENCSTVILKKLPKKLGDPGKFLILCGFSELKCKALANLEASINLMPLSIWKKLGLPDLIPTQMTLELANRRPFLRTARALIDVHSEEMILCDEDERLTLNMKHDTASYSNHPYKESVNLIDIFNLSKMFTKEQPLDYSFPSRFDVYPGDFLEIESDA